MHCSMPPYTKPEAAYDSARLCRETSEIAAAQDAKLDGRPRDDLQSIMADLHLDLTRAYENAKCRVDAIDRRARVIRDALPPNLARAVSGIGDVPYVRRSPLAAEADRIAEVERRSGPESWL